MFDSPSRRSFFGGAAATALGLLVPRNVSFAAGKSAGRQVSPEGRLRELGIELPTPVRPIATYVPTVVVGSVLYVAGHTPRQSDGSASPQFQGKVGAGLSIEEGQAAARLVGMNILAAIRAELASLDRVVRLVRTFGMVNAPPDFTQQPAVINGFSDFMVDIFGSDAGKGTRAAVGMGSLPGGMAVEIETYWEIRG